MAERKIVGAAAVILFLASVPCPVRTQTAPGGDVPAREIVEKGDFRFSCDERGVSAWPMPTTPSGPPSCRCRPPPDGRARRPAAGQPRWESVFREHGIRYAVIPIFYPRGGGVLDLLFALADSPRWAPVFIGANAVVFVEDTPENRRVARVPLASRDQFLSILVERCSQLNERFPSYPFPYIARGDLLVRLRRYDAARAAYRSALGIMPFNERARRRLAALPP